MSRIPTTAPVTAAKELFAAVGPYAAVADLTAADWADIAGHCQAGIRVLEATQTLALARVAATDDVVDDRDGMVVEEFIGLGHQRLDAPALVSAQLSQTDAGAGRRVATAVDLVTRLPRLVQAMGTGDLDLYRATRVADELAECPVEVCEEVLDRISAEHLASDPVGPLGRRVRRALAAVNSDLLKKRRVRALSDTGLTRSVDADGVDTWIARMPLEQSAQLWDAIEDRAQLIRAQAAAAANAAEVGADCPDGDQHAEEAVASRPRRMSIHAARLAALTEILMGNITGTFHLHLGVPMSLFGQGDGPEQPTNDDNGPGTDPVGGADPTTEPTADGPATDPLGDADPSGNPTVDRNDCGDAAKAAGVPKRSSSSARSDGACCGLVFPGAAGVGAAGVGDPDDLIPVTGFGTAGTVHLRRAFVEHLLRAAAGGGAVPAHQHLGQTPARFTVARDVIGCHDHTGAYLTGPTDLRHWLDLTDPTTGPPPAAPRTDAYRPTAALRRLLTARDGRCRFPNCQAAARFADVDHVQAWPTGATDLAGLALLCRRHHRIKQRHRWHVRILPDATLEWVTPTGQVRITTPVDHLEPARPPRTPPVTDQTAVTEATGATSVTDPIGRPGDRETRSGTSLFGDPILPPTPPAQLAPDLPPRAGPSTGDHPRGDFGWLQDVYATSPDIVGRQGRVRHPVTITHAELERCATRGQATRAAAEADRLAAQRAAERAARDAEPPPF